MIFQLLKDAEDFDVYRVERIFSSLSGFRGQRTLRTFSTSSFSMMSEAPNSAVGKVDSADQINFKLRLNNGQSVKVRQPFGAKGQVLAKVAQINSTALAIFNPHMIVSSAYSTGKTLVDIDVEFDDIYTGDANWLIARANGTLIALYSSKLVGWKRLESLDVRPFGSSIEAIGSHNVWICHAEESNEHFSRFVSRVINSQIEIVEKFDDDFKECLFKHHCFDSGPQRLLACLRGDCDLRHFGERSKTATCLSDKDQSPLISDADKIMRMRECLSGPLMDIELKWQMGRNVFQFGFDEESPLQFWRDNRIVDLPNEKDFRYKIGPTTASLREKLFSLVNFNDTTLQLDFERLKYEENLYNIQRT